MAQNPYPFKEVHTDSHNKANKHKFFGYMVGFTLSHSGKNGYG